MTCAAIRRFATVTAIGVTASIAATAPSGAATWEPFPLPPPPGGVVSTPVGYPGDLTFFAPNRGVMTIEGNGSVPNGLYSWNGREWHQLATVCGGSTNARVAWAGPTEFWTLASPSPGVAASGAICHFKDGAVTGSFAGTNVPGYDHVVSAAACRTPDDCWFGGPSAESADRAQIGAFHLRWDGRNLQPVYAPQGRAVSDIESHGGRLLESVLVGGSAGSTRPPVLRDHEPVPALLHSIDGQTFTNDPWTPAPVPGVPDDGAELRALDSDGTTAWAVGGKALSGPGAGVGRGRLPLVVRLEGDRWTELQLHGDVLQPSDVFGDVAAVPGTRTAWATLPQAPLRGSDQAQPRVAFIDAGGAVTVHELAGAGDPLRGDAVRVACPTSDDCWLATARGYLYRWGGAKQYEVDTDPAFQGTITERPNEGAAQFVPDAPPDDDSRLFAPPVEVPIEPDEPPASCRQPPRLMTGVRPPRVTPVGGRRAPAKGSASARVTARQTAQRFRLTVGFRLARRARVALIAERRVTAPRRGSRGPRGPASGRSRVVARTPLRTLGSGRRTLSVIVRRASWPTRLRFESRETGRPRCVAAAAQTAAAR